MKEFSDARRRLYKRMLRRHRAQYINNEKYFLAASAKKKKGEIFNWMTTIFSALLLYMIAEVAGGESLSTPVLVLAGGTAVFSFASVVGSWQAQADDLYKSGQIHRNLYHEFDEMLKEQLADRSRSDEELKNECERLLRRQTELNRATPQLSSKWYHRLIYRDNGAEWNYDRSLEDIEDGISKFYTSDEKSTYTLKFKRYIVWPIM